MFILWQNLHLVAVHLQVAAERHRRAGPAAVKQAPRRASVAHLGNHRQDWGDSDATGKEQVFVVRAEFEVVARPADFEELTRTKCVVHVCGAAARQFFAEYRDPVDEPVGRVAAQRVLAHDIAEQQVDVRAGSPGRQHAAKRIGQFDRDDAVGLDAELDDAQVEHTGFGVVRLVPRQVNRG